MPLRPFTVMLLEITKQRKMGKATSTRSRKTSLRPDPLDFCRKQLDGSCLKSLQAQFEQMNENLEAKLDMITSKHEHAIVSSVVKTGPSIVEKLNLDTRTFKARLPSGEAEVAAYSNLNRLNEPWPKHNITNAKEVFEAGHE